jgi:hypothetical protein
MRIATSKVCRSLMDVLRMKWRHLCWVADISWRNGTTLKSPAANYVRALSK